MEKITKETIIREIIERTVSSFQRMLKEKICVGSIKSIVKTDILYEGKIIEETLSILQKNDWDLQYLKQAIEKERTENKIVTQAIQFLSERDQWKYVDTNAFKNLVSITKDEITVRMIDECNYNLKELFVYSTYLADVKESKAIRVDFYSDHDEIYVSKIFTKLFSLFQHQKIPIVFEHFGQVFLTMTGNDDGILATDVEIGTEDEYDRASDLLCQMLPYFLESNSQFKIRQFKITLQSMCKIYEEFDNIQIETLVITDYKGQTGMSKIISKKDMERLGKCRIGNIIGENIGNSGIGGLLKNIDIFQEAKKEQN